MRKHDEGYTLPLVMVVLLVLAIVAVTIMTTSMNNMLRQQSFIEQMEAQYIAQGKIEMVVAKLHNIKDENALANICKDIVDYKIVSLGEEEKEEKKGLMVELTAKDKAEEEGPALVTIVCKVYLAETAAEEGNATVMEFDGYRSYEIGGGTP